MSGDSGKGRYTSPEGSAIWEYIATASCSLMIFCVGCVIGWNSPTLGILMRPDAPVPLTPSDASTLSAMIALGHALAPVLTMVMIKMLGRRNSIMAIGIPMIISWGLISLTNNIAVLFVARFIGGLSLGLIFCFPPMYLGEIASPKLRGGISMVCGTMLNTGLLFMFLTVPYVSVQTMARICLSIVTGAVISVWFIPESPYFLAVVGKFEEAESALEKLRGKTDVAEELELIKMTVGRKGKGADNPGDDESRETSQTSNPYKQLFSVAGNRRALFISLLLPAALYFGGYISITTYTQRIFERMKTGYPVYVCTMIVASLQIVCNILTVFVIDRLGRKPLICISGVISGSCLVTVGIYFYLMEYTKIDVTPYSTFALCAVFVNIVALNIGLMPLQHVIQCEILATEIKELATCIIGVIGGVMAIIGVKSYLMLAETWDFGHCVPFFCSAADIWICTTIILKLLPETKGKTLFEIQRDLNA